MPGNSARYKVEAMAEALADAMRLEGCELDDCDRLIIRKTISGALAAQRQRLNRSLSAGKTYCWQKPNKIRR